MSLDDGIVPGTKNCERATPRSMTGCAHGKSEFALESASVQFKVYSIVESRIALVSVKDMSSITWFIHDT